MKNRYGLIPSFKRTLWLTMASLCAMSVGHAADAPPPGQMPPAIRGTVVKFADHKLTLKTVEREEMTVTVPANAGIIENRPVLLSDVRANEFIGTTAVAEQDGRLHSREIHIFPESMRGAGEGHRPMDSPGTTMTNGNIATMTNGNVSGTVNGSGGQAGSGMVLEVSYPGGKQQIVVGPDTQVTRMSPSDTSILKPGAQVMVFAEQNKEGWVARQISVTGASR